MMVKHLLSMQDLSTKEVEVILDKAAELKQKLKKGEPHEILQGKTLAMIFEKPSTRTRVSFEVAMNQLGGHAIYLGVKDIQIGRGETIADTARTLSRYVDGIVVRLFKHVDAVELARHSSVPVINGLTDMHHPCQTLADLLTIREKKGRLKGLKVAWVGDGNNVCNSLMQGCSLLGINFSAACPKGFEPCLDVVKQAEENARTSGAKITVLADPKKAVEGADVVYTDVWVSMGQEKEAKKRTRAFKAYQVNASLLQLAKADAIFMHCLPAHRGLEVTEDVIDGPHSVVWDQAENRLHAQKALLVSMLGAK
jgi:ornithine carbamoyltransferase